MDFRTALFFGALALSSPPLFAQPRGIDCSQAKDPTACEERVGKMKSAQKACEGKTGEEHAGCLREQFCSQAKDPKGCEERVAKMREAHQSARQACEGKARGAEHQQCMIQQTCSRAKDPAKCEAEARDHIAMREKIQEACKGKVGEDMKACVRDQRSQK